MNQPATNTQTSALIQQIDDIRTQLENSGHEHLKNFVEAIDKVEALSNASEKQLSELQADIDMLDSESPPPAEQA